VNSEQLPDLASVAERRAGSRRGDTRPDASAPLELELLASYRRWTAWGPPSEGVRFRFAKRIAWRFLSPLTDRQARLDEYVTVATAATALLADEVRSLRGRIEELEASVDRYTGGGTP
jgi:hypothetical protein